MLVVILPMAFMACTQATPPAGADPEDPRPLGKADGPGSGSCEGRCGGISRDESCWCDPRCAVGSDTCCADKVEWCGDGSEENPLLPFLAVEDYEGTIDSREGPPSLVGGQATFHGHIRFFNMPRADVERALPEGLTLAAPHTARAQTVHPVIVLWGQQGDGRLNFGAFSVPAVEPYLEMMIFIPFVRAHGSTKLHLYPVRMYLTNEDAKWSANTYYGYNKVMAEMEIEGTGVSYADDIRISVDGVPHFAGSSGSAGTGFMDIHFAHRDLRNFDEMLEIMSMPIVGQLDDGELVCSYFDWDFSHASIAALSRWPRIHFHEPPAPGTESWVSLSPMSGVQWGGFRLYNLVWKIGFPAGDCHF